MSIGCLYMIAHLKLVTTADCALQRDPHPRNSYCVSCDTVPATSQSHLYWLCWWSTQAHIDINNALEMHLERNRMSFADCNWFPCWRIYMHCVSLLHLAKAALQFCHRNFSSKWITDRPSNSMQARACISFVSELNASRSPSSSSASSFSLSFDRHPTKVKA